MTEAPLIMRLLYVETTVPLNSDPSSLFLSSTVPPNLQTFTDYHFITSSVSLYCSFTRCKLT